MCTLSTDHIAQDPAGAWQLFLQAIKAGEAVVVTENNRLLATVQASSKDASTRQQLYESVQQTRALITNSTSVDEVTQWLNESTI
jgi:antitoxin (DNA-binding transcriptional repressor) of toxin-antitoxin stability system